MKGADARWLSLRSSSVKLRTSPAHGSPGSCLRRTEEGTEKVIHKCMWANQRHRSLATAFEATT